MIFLKKSKLEEEGNDFKKLLKKKNLKNTKHRNSVLKAIETSSEPVTAEEIYLSLQKEDISISLSTVYRIIEVLINTNIVCKISFTDNNKALYEINNSSHRHHLLCLNCRNVFPVEDCPLGKHVQTLEEKFNFIITSHNLEFYGYCKNCK